MEEWYVNGTYAGTWQTGRNMTYVRVSHANVGHGIELKSRRIGGRSFAHGTNSGFDIAHQDTVLTACFDRSALMSRK